MATVMSSPKESQAAISATRLLINNRWIPSESGKTFATINPRPVKRSARLPRQTPVMSRRPSKRHAPHFERGPWRKMMASERGRLLHRLADVIEKNGDELARLETLDNGKSVSVAKAVDVAATVGCFHYFAGWSDKVHGKTIPIDGGLFLLHPPRACRRGRPDHSMELSDADAGMETRPGVGDR
jgi:aldehyde dehydrogenase (NAD+)